MSASPHPTLPRRRGRDEAPAMMQPLDPHAVRAMLSDGEELALIDLREELIYSQNHLLWARSVPLSRLELNFARLVPRRGHAHRAHRRAATVSSSAPAISLPARVTAICSVSPAASLPGGRRDWSCSPASTSQARRSASSSSMRAARPASAPVNSMRCCAPAPTSSCSTAVRSKNMRACRFRPPPTCRARSWCCTCATLRRHRRPWSWSIARGAPAASSGRSR